MRASFQLRLPKDPADGKEERPVLNMHWQLEHRPRIKKVEYLRTCLSN